MNSNSGKSNQPKASSSLSLNNFNFDFDLGIGSNRPKSLNDQKNPNPPSYSYSSSSSSSSAQPRPAWQPNKPSWTHQPAPPPATQAGLPGGPTPMVGDIFGKTWGSTQPSTTAPIGIVNKNPNLFGDLVSSALGQPPKNSSSSNVPLKNASKVSAPTTSKTSSFSMGNMADSLPKTGNINTTSQTNASWGSSGNFGSFSSGNSMNANKSPNLGTGISSNNKDPFSSLAGIGSKQSASLNSAAKPQRNDSEDDGFGDFQNASKSSFPAASPQSSGGAAGIDINFSGSATLNQTPVQSSGGDPMDMFFSSSTASAGGASGVQPSSEMDDWGLESDFGRGGHDVGGTTTELEGLPPPPAGISGSAAKGKGMDNYKQGQFADAIKWLSWAVVLLEKAGDDAATVEVLSCRASCYKEVGEYKKAVADCTKVYFDILLLTSNSCLLVYNLNYIL